MANWHTGTYAAAPPNRNRTILSYLVGFCVIMAIAIAATAYFGFFKNPGPGDVVEEYMSLAVSGDYGGARALTCPDAADNVRLSQDDFDANTEADIREMFYDDDHTWEIEGEHRSGGEATVVMDWRLDAGAAELPSQSWVLHNKRFFSLEERHGAWLICRADSYPVVADDVFAVGDCYDTATVYGDPAEPVECDSGGESLYEVMEFADSRKLCPNPDEWVLVTESGPVACLAPVDRN